jgi:hypothetical protein
MGAKLAEGSLTETVTAEYFCNVMSNKINLSHIINFYTILYLQIVLAAFLHLSTAQVIRYPDPLDSARYYYRYGTPPNFTHQKCSGILLFNTNVLGCTLPPVPEVNLTGYIGPPCNGYGFYCVGNNFTYCTPDNYTIAGNVPCPIRTTCNISASTPCV